MYIGDGIIRVTNTEFIQNWAIPDSHHDTCISANNGVCNYIDDKKDFRCDPYTDQYDCIEGEQLLTKTLRPFYSKSS